MLHKIICTPNCDLPQKIDINTIRKELEQQEQEVTSGKAVKTLQFDYDSDDDVKKPKLFNVLPLHCPPNAELKMRLSFQHNEYLACKFDKFLTNKPIKEGFHLRLHREMKIKQGMPKPRRMKLNGKFYDADHKLAPAPFFPDPRQYFNKRSSRNLK